jgi:hypothetical protein
MTTESKKGAAIKFIGGSHVGCSGWINKTKDPTENYISVIVVLKKTKEEKITKVKIENYVLLTSITEPTNYEQAMLRQHADIDEMLNTLVRKMAECEGIDVAGTSGEIIGNLFLARLGKAIARQNVKGSKARWRRVRWP